MYLKQWEWALATVWRLRTAHVLEAMGVGPGDRLEITEGPDGFILKPKRIDYSKLGLLRDLIPPDAPPFDIREFRDGTYDSSLRD
jgi:bifunctional DNA-binding transcriptional regulator/antitoxin component of YhaV-PrlF toxin-antitoxin module